MTASPFSVRKDRYILAVIDFVALYLALFLALLIRYDGSFTWNTFSLHAFPFTVISLFSILAYYIAGIYERSVIYSLKKVAARLLNAEISVTLGSIVFFYLYNNPSITPKTTLTLYVAFSYVIVFLIRLIYVRLSSRPTPVSAILIANGSEADELYSRSIEDGTLGMRFIGRIDPGDPILEERVRDMIERNNPSVIVIDNGHPAMAKILPSLYEFIFSSKRFIDVQTLYEDVFERVPLSLVRYEWFLEHASAARSQIYAIVRKVAEFIIALVLLVPTLVLMPFVILAIKLDDNGVIFSYQTRIGKGGRLISLMKFRTMTVANDGGKWISKDDNRHTRIGRFLRKTRIDELPQIFSVLKGDLSLIGPRPDIENLGRELERQLPFYRVRYIVTPGLSGWAQIKQELPPQSIEETRLRLSYDLYYVKNRSLILDLAIALRTVAILLSRKGM
jgi:lipopolysaccharide/colanic/teichoic acid biosynthesis glycosyltransferase